MRVASFVPCLAIGINRASANNVKTASEDLRPKNGDKKKQQQPKRRIDRSTKISLSLRAHVSLKIKIFVDKTCFFLLSNIAARLPLPKIEKTKRICTYNTYN